jgi:hypothetical protein
VVGPLEQWFMPGTMNRWAKLMPLPLYFRTARPTGCPWQRWSGWSSFKAQLCLFDPQP